MGNSASSASSLPALQTVANCETASLMGTWFVIGVKPTMFEKTCSNAVENYSLVEGKKNDIAIDFKYNAKDPITSPLKSLPQKGWIQGNKENSAEWKVSPFWPVKMPYLIIEVDEKDYAWIVIGYPNRDYAWIMHRNPVMPTETYDMLKQRLVDNHQYDLEGLRDVPQVWTKAEREKRGFTAAEIPDTMLSDK